MHTPLDILHKYWGHTSFRSLQEDIINSVLEGKDTLALMPTGGGKSITFQVPALCKEGLCLVITPLIALMKDQVENLKKMEIPAVAVYSGMSYREIDMVFDNAMAGQYKFLYLSPERLETEIFSMRLPNMNVSLIAVDESHCISQWGYDFRPSYLNIANIRKTLPDVPIIAVTATATPKVVIDIQEKLEFREENVFQKSFTRENLAYVVLHEEGKIKRLIKILTNVAGSSVVYVRSRRKTKEIADMLRSRSIQADYYHAGLSHEMKEKKQHEWSAGKLRVIVSTNAFGMGIDKADVRTVIHMDLPDSIEAYFQEAGRAGRDGKKAFAILLVNNADKAEYMSRLDSQFPPIAEVRRIYQALGNYLQLAFGAGEFQSFDFDIGDFANRFSFNVNTVFQSIKILAQQEWLVMTEPEEYFSRLKFAVGNSDVYKFEVENNKFEPLIKLLLRAYTGVFDEYVKVSESVMAKQLKTDVKTITKALEYLQEQGIVNYRQRKDHPQLTFLKDRVDAPNLHLDVELLAIRKKNTEDKLKAMLQYADQDDRCRSLELLAYFGEVHEERCGVCDVCLERNKLEMSKLEFESIRNELESVLREQAIDVAGLVEKLTQFKEGQVLKCIEWLLDHQWIKQDNNNTLVWSKKSE